MTIKKYIPTFCLLILVVNVFFTQIKKTNLTFFEAVEINVFLFILFFFVNIVRVRITKKKKRAPAAFLSLNFFRIIFCVLFFIIKIRLGKQVGSIYVLNFFIIYFVYILSEIYVVYKKSKQTR